MTTIRRCVASAIIVSAFVISQSTPANAPRMVANEIAVQRSLGYTPCEPTISQLPLEVLESTPELLADAAPDFMFQVCEIRFATNNIPAKDLDWIAWHEVCHLSTMKEIFADPFRPIIDPAHIHSSFKECISYGPVETGGY